MEYLPHIATIAVALIGTLTAMATQRSATKANRTAVRETSRADMEKDAYERARAFDTATISRQNALIDELNEDNDALRVTNKELRSKLEACENKGKDDDEE